MATIYRLSSIKEKLYIWQVRDYLITLPLSFIFLIYGNYRSLFNDPTTKKQNLEH